MSVKNLAVLGLTGLVVVLTLYTGVVSGVPQAMSTPSDSVPAVSTATTQDQCAGDAREQARISQSSIQAIEDRITTDQPALISGQVVTPSSNQCVVIVQMILTIPTDMYVAGTDDVGSSGQGKLSATFRVSPGETRSMSAQVYASAPGTRVLIADFLYYPAGHPDEERRLTGFSMEIEAVEANMPGSDNNDTTGDSGNSELPIAGIGLVFLVGVLIWLFQ